MSDRGAMVTQNLRMIPAPLKSRIVSVSPGFTYRASPFPPLRSQLPSCIALPCFGNASPASGLPSDAAELSLWAATDGANANSGITAAKIDRTDTIQQTP